MYEQHPGLLSLDIFSMNQEAISSVPLMIISPENANVLYTFDSYTPDYVQDLLENPGFDKKNYLDNNSIPIEKKEKMEKKQKTEEKIEVAKKEEKKNNNFKKKRKQNQSQKKETKLLAKKEETKSVAKEEKITNQTKQKDPVKNLRKKLEILKKAKRNSRI